MQRTIAGNDMLLNYLKTKIHRATVTEARLDYEGSITIDQTLMLESGILPYEQVHVYNVATGDRFVTYAMEGIPGSGVCCVNGAAARMVSVGDKVIIVAYCQLSAEEAKDFEPRILLVNDKNQIKDNFTVRAGSPKPEGYPLKDRS